MSETLFSAVELGDEIILPVKPRSFVNPMYRDIDEWLAKRAASKKSWYKKDPFSEPESLTSTEARSMLATRLDFGYIDMSTFTGTLLSSYETAQLSTTLVNGFPKEYPVVHIPANVLVNNSIVHLKDWRLTTDDMNVPAINPLTKLGTTYVMPRRKDIIAAMLQDGGEYARYNVSLLFETTNAARPLRLVDPDHILRPVSVLGASGATAAILPAATTIVSEADVTESSLKRIYNVCQNVAGNIPKVSYLLELWLQERELRVSVLSVRRANVV